MKPIAVGVGASSWSGYESGIFSCPEDPNVNHAVLLVGYTSLQHWIVKNSWGKTWGDDGYIIINRARDCNICKRSGIRAELS